MCGIAGFLSGSVSPRETAEAMARTLKHRGPDALGVWTDSEAGVGFGHARLSILELSELGAQPMVSACGRYVLAYNGELYNFRALRAELEKGGVAFRGGSDTEVLLSLVSRDGVREAVGRINGMFAFALWDRRERVLTLGRDRMGEKPLYYGWSGRSFLFGSELNALRAFPGFKAEIDRDSVALYLRHNCVPSPYAIFKGVRKLPPGCLLEVRPGAADAAPQEYWSLKEAAERGVGAPFAGSVEEAGAVLEKLLLESVSMRMESDVPLGAFLSGGIDSALVVALMQAQSKRPVRTFTLGSTIPSYDESKEARAVAEHLGTDHTELCVSDKATLEVIPRLARIYDEPFSDSSQIPAVLVSELARRNVTVALSGDGGDELFAGYNRHFWGRTIWNRVGWLPQGVRGLAGELLGSVSAPTWDRSFAALAPVLPKGFRHRAPGEKLQLLGEVLASSSAEEFYSGLVSHWKNPSAVVLGSKEPLTALTDPKRRAEFTDIAQRMLYLDSTSYLPDDILTKLDRASMSVSLEARVPLLDHRLVEFAWTLPLSMKLSGNKGKLLLRQVLGRYVPPALFERPKKGFGVPIDAWLRGPLRDWAESLLDEKRLREGGIFDPAPIRAMWSEHLSGLRNRHYVLWDILMFEAWRDEWSGPRA